MVAVGSARRMFWKWGIVTDAIATEWLASWASYGVGD
jgi:hypothetical protein